MTSGNKRIIVGLEVLLVLIITGYFYFFVDTIAFVTIYETRDLLRGIAWLKGEVLFHGPELSGGGYTPGPLFYFMSSIALLFKKSWWSIHYMKLGFGMAMAVTSFFAGRQYFGRIGGWMFLLLLLSARTMYSSFAIDWNASFQGFFSLVAIWALYQAFENGRKKTLYFFFAFTGLSCQIHGSFVVFLILFLFCQLVAPALSWRRFSLRETATGFLWFLVPSIPYMLWLVFGGALDFFSHSKPPPLKIFWELWSFLRYNFRRGAELVGQGPSQLLTMSFLENPFIESVYLKWTVILSPILIVAHRLRTGKAVDKRVYRGVALFLFITLIYAPILTSNMSLRYLVHWKVVYVFSVFLVAGACLQKIQPVVNNWLGSRLTVSLGILLFSLFFGLESIGYTKMMEGRLKYNEALATTDDELGFHRYITLNQAIGACKTIHEQTGWSADKIKRNVFVIRMANGWDMYSLCRELAPENGSEPKSHSPEKIHGYFLFRHVEVEGDPDRWKEWFDRQPKPPEFIEGFKVGSIRLLEANFVNGMVVLPYTVESPTALPLEAHNQGYGYFPEPGESELLAIPMNDDRGVFDPESEDSLWFYFNECKWEGQEQCRAGVQVKGMKNLQQSDGYFSLRLVGTPLSTRVWYLHPYMSMSWYDSRVEIECENGLDKIAVASQVGNHFVEESRNDVFFVTPFERRLRTSCRENVKSVSFVIGNYKGFNSIERINEDNVRLTKEY